MAVVDPVDATLLVEVDVSVIPVTVEFGPPAPVAVDIVVEFVTMPLPLVEVFKDVLAFAVELAQVAVKNT